MLFLIGMLFVGSSSASRATDADYSRASWVAASSKNFQRADRPFSSPITRIVIHTTEAPYASAIRLFAHAGPVASAAYVIRSGDGSITQMVHETDVAWHAGNRQYNATSIGIEHEAFVHDCSWYTSAMYRSSARLVAHLATKYGIRSTARTSSATTKCRTRTTWAGSAGLPTTSIPARAGTGASTCG